MDRIYHRMEQDLKLRELSEGTRYAYLRQVVRCARYFDCPVEHLGQLSDEDLRHYLLHHLALGQGPAGRKMAIAALKFFFEITLGQPQRLHWLPYPKVPHPLPPILSGTEVQALLCAVDSLKYRTVLMALYGSVSARMIGFSRTRKMSCSMGGEG